MREIILAHMGGPDTADELRMFLRNIFKDRDMIKLPLQGLLGPLIAALRFKKSLANYEKTGWTPVKKLTISLAAKLSKIFENDGLRVRALYTHVPPYIEEAGPDALVLPLYPHYSSVLAGLMEKRLSGRTIIREWHRQGKFLEMTEKNAANALSLLGSGEKTMLFIAHSLPEAVIKNNDPYIRDIEETYRVLAAKFSGFECRLAYIGKAGPGKWVGPEASGIIKEAGKRAKKIAVVYLSFPLDNIEVLYDIDIKLKQEAADSGAAGFARAVLPNDSGEFTGLMEKVIRENL
jgi:ferrochelatase